MSTVRTLLIDNYDSYTYNLHNILAEVNRVEPLVVANDATSLQDIRALVEEGRVDNIVISPGPGTPAHSGDVGVCLDVLKALPHVPILGVCLGHQALAHVHGGKVVNAPEPVHGRLSTLQHTGHPLFNDIPSGSGRGFEVVRYHSLTVEPSSLPECLAPIAWTCGGHHAVHLSQDEPSTPPLSQGSSSDAGALEDPTSLCGGHAGGGAPVPSRCELIMALAHRTHPHFGVQFHPESVSTRFGIALLSNFCRLTLQARGSVGLPRPLPNLIGPPGCAHAERPWPSPEHQRGAGLRLAWTRLASLLGAAPGGTAAAQRIFHALYGFADDTFWLDSSSAPDRGRFSYMGGRGGRLWRRITYRLPPAAESAADGPHAAPRPGTVHQEDWRGATTTSRSAFLPFLADLLERHRMRVDAADAVQLPFNFWGGLVGYLGFELKAECGGRHAHDAHTPDAAFLLADRAVALDHAQGDVYVLSMYSTDEPGAAEAEAEARAWLGATSAQLQQLAELGLTAPTCGAAEAGAAGGAPGGSLGGGQQRAAQAAAAATPRTCAPAGARCATAAPFRLRHDRAAYTANIETYRRALHDGESYEVCATTTLERPGAPHAPALYSTLRRLNPAPYSAWLSLGGPSALAVCCSSPERFLRCDRGSVLEARPIKGTAPRRPDDPAEDARLAHELATSEKERAENLMIVDLLRNDLGRVCDVGSVHVPGLMEIESFATVHQMVSTVRGTRRPDASIVDCLRATFPGGSMTGAPKVRTMEILDAHEGRARGVYSGSLGFISFNDTFDLNIVIRTAVIDRAPPAGAHAESPDGTWIRIGAGGAIVVQSDTDAEYEEMRLKARALMRAVGACDGSDQPAVVDDASPHY